MFPMQAYLYEKKASSLATQPQGEKSCNHAEGRGVKIVRA